MGCMSRDWSYTLLYKPTLLKVKLADGYGPAACRNVYYLANNYYVETG